MRARYQKRLKEMLALLLILAMSFSSITVMAKDLPAGEYTITASAEMENSSEKITFDDGTILSVGDYVSAGTTMNIVNFTSGIIMTDEEPSAFIGGLPRTVHEVENNQYEISRITLIDMSTGGKGIELYLRTKLTGNAKIQGQVKVGSQLTVEVTESNAGAGTQYNYRWKRDNEEIEDATSASYTLTAKDMGTTISVEISTENFAGSIIATKEIKQADYTELDKAIDAAKALNAEDYEDFSAVTKELEAAEKVSRDLTADDQDTVDDAANALNDAMKALTKKVTGSYDYKITDLLAKLFENLQTGSETPIEVKVGDKILWDDTTKDYYGLDYLAFMPYESAVGLEAPGITDESVVGTKYYYESRIQKNQIIEIGSTYQSNAEEKGITIQSKRKWYLTVVGDLVVLYVPKDAGEDEEVDESTVTLDAGSGTFSNGKSSVTVKLTEEGKLDAKEADLTPSGSKLSFLGWVDALTEKLFSVRELLAKKYDVSKQYAYTASYSNIESDSDIELEHASSERMGNNGGLLTKGVVNDNSSIEDISFKNDLKSLYQDNKLFKSQEKKKIEDGTDAKVWLLLGDDEATEEEEKALEKKIQDWAGEDASWELFDLKLMKQVGDADAVAVTETSKMMEITIVIPEDIREADEDNMKRSFRVYRYHNGKAEQVSQVSYRENTGEYTFKTNKFSTYALAWKDGKVRRSYSGGSGGGSTSIAGKSAAAISSGNGVTVLLKDTYAGAVWEKIDSNDWKLKKADNTYATGWAAKDGKWYFLGADGIMQRDWLLDENKWYHLSEDGSMDLGWYLDDQDNYWYYLDPNTGAMHTGWTVIDGKSYLLNSTVPKQTWFQAGGSWQYDRSATTRPLGSLYVSAETPDGKKVDENGVKVSA